MACTAGTLEGLFLEWETLDPLASLCWPVCSDQHVTNHDLTHDRYSLCNSASVFFTFSLTYIELPVSAFAARVLC